MANEIHQRDPYKVSLLFASLKIQLKFSCIPYFWNLFTLPAFVFKIYIAMIHLTIFR